MTKLNLTLLGGFQARLGDGPVLALPVKAQALLAYLALQPVQAHPRDALAALLWGDSGETQARDNLRHTVAALRRALTSLGRPVLVVGEGHSLTLEPAAVDVDAAAFERRLGEATPEALEAAAELYRGDLLDGLGGAGQPRFEAWLLAERERLRALAVEALARLLAYHTRAGAVERATATAMRLLALDPRQEIVHRALMRLYAGQGRRGAALRQYQVCVGTLRRELDAGPEPETRELYQEILRGRPMPPAAAAPAMPAHDTALIGRAEMLARLTTTLDEAWREGLRMVVITGEAGVGKTRLMEELGALAPARGGRVLLGRGHETEQSLPFGPWVDALRGGGITADAAAKLDAAARAELSRLFPELGAASTRLAAPDNPGRLFEGIATLLAGLAARTPLLVVLDDLHWADEMTLRLLAWLGRRLVSSTLMIVGTARDEEVGSARLLRRAIEELGREPHFRALWLPCLTEPDVAELVRGQARAGTDAATLARLGQRAWEASEGNPFVALETARALQDGRLAGDAIAVSARVREVIARRLDALSDHARRLAGAAAVIGRECDFPLLRGAAGLGEPETAAALEELVRERVLQAVGERFDFIQARVRHVAHDALPAPARQLLHAAAGRTLEALYAPDLEPVYDRLAFHYARADEPVKAVAYLARFAERAAAGYAHADAVDALREARAQLARMPAAERDRPHADLVLRQTRSLSFLGRFEEALALLRAERLADPRLSGRYYFLRGNTESLLGEGERATADARRAREAAERAGDAFTLGRAHYVLSLEGFWSGRLAEGVSHGQESVRQLEPGGHGIWLGLAHWVLGFNHTLLGEFAPALVAEAHAATIARALRDARLESAAAWTTGGLHALVGASGDAIAACQHGLELSPDPLNTALATGWLGYAHLVHGDTKRAIALLEDAVEQYTRFRFRARGWFTAWLAEARLAQGDAAAARTLAAEGLTRAREAAQGYGEGIAERAVGLVHLAEDDGAAASQALRAARATFERIGAGFEIGRTDLALARAALHAGDKPAAGRHVSEAHARFLALGVETYVMRAKTLGRTAGVRLA